MAEKAIIRNFKVREYQKEFIREFEYGNKKRFLVVWPRRAGKDLCTFLLLVSAALKVVAVYYYILPTYSQAKRIIFDTIDPKSGMKFFDYIHPDFIKKINQSDMTLELKNGSLITFVGSESYDRLVGTNAYGMVFSEFALQDYACYTHLRPILTANNGWMIVISTPRGRNHLYNMYEIAKDNPKDWYVSKLTLDDTKHISLEAIDIERQDEELSEDMIQQEYYTSFSMGSSGSFYSRYIDKMYLDNRIGYVPYENAYQVNTCWDIGLGDSTAIIWFAVVGNRVLILNSYENKKEGLEHYVEKLEEYRKKYGYHYNWHFAPHDVRVKDWGAGITRLEKAHRLGIEFVVTKNVSIEDGIEAARTALSKCWIDESNNKQLIKALTNYRSGWDEKRKEYSRVPIHDNYSHFADAFRYLALNLPRTRDEHTAQDIDRYYKEAHGLPYDEPRLY